MCPLSTQKVGINLPVALRTPVPAVHSVRWFRVRSRASARPTIGWKMCVSSTDCAMQNSRSSPEPDRASTITRSPVTTASLSGMPSGRAADADRTIDGHHRSLRLPSKRPFQWIRPRKECTRPCGPCLHQQALAFLDSCLPDPASARFHDLHHMSVVDVDTHCCSGPSRFPDQTMHIARHSRGLFRGTTLIRLCGDAGSRPCDVPARGALEAWGRAAIIVHEAGLSLRA